MEKILASEHWINQSVNFFTYKDWEYDVLPWSLAMKYRFENIDL